MAIKPTKTTPAGHTAGIYADMSLDGPEIGTLVAVIDRAKNLPNRRTMGKQDPYCAMRLGKEAKKTDTDRRGGQTPRWDQELRFTVHESPDYYKLKCSVFNDDKKTDLIGEAWIDLKDIIVPGGGQNDFWHQLSFKGKYAGDIRMEMTYYDTRVHPEPQADKKRSREKGYPNPNNRNSQNDGSRHLGPREIQRRPLPPNPAQPQSSDMPAPLSIQPRYPPPQTHAHPSEHQTYYQQQQPLDSSDAFGYDQSQSQSDPYQDPDSYQSFYQSHEDNDAAAYFDQQPGDTFRLLYDSQDPPQVPPKTQWNDSPQAGSYHSHSSSLPNTPQHSSPPVRQSPPSIPQESYRDHRISTSPTKYTPFRDSPLRQSISHQEPLLPQLPPKVDAYDIQAPPRPPAHRGSLPRQTIQPPFSTPPQQHYHQPTPRQGTIDDRSPLQMLEHQYSPNSPSSNRSSGQRLSHVSQRDQFFEQTISSSPPAAVPITGEFPAPHQLSLNFGVDFVSEPVEQDRQGRYVRRNSALESQDFPGPQLRSQSYDAGDVFDEANTFRSEPHLVKPRAVSPNAGHTIPRKSVSPNPYPSSDRSRMSGIPFGPDSYEVLNPASSPISHGRSTPEQSREAVRQQEVNRLREQGPIIGNDGRVIDPSDHLPSDTWAPEPERKNRKPEHVIHVRRKKEPQEPRPDSSPLPNRPMTTSSSPHATIPEPISVPHSGRRNRLQKQVPQRPLPTQPFVHSHTSPAAIPQVRSSNQMTPNQLRTSMPSSPLSSPPRPALSEYQVPVGNTYNPRNSYHAPAPQHFHPTPTKGPKIPQMPQRPQSFAYGGHNDPLSAEMSMIDIGPSRGGGRTALRSNRGYSGY